MGFYRHYCYWNWWWHWWRGGVWIMADLKVASTTPTSAQIVVDGITVEGANQVVLSYYLDDIYKGESIYRPNDGFYGGMEFTGLSVRTYYKVVAYYSQDGMHTLHLGFSIEDTEYPRPSAFQWTVQPVTGQPVSNSITAEDWIKVQDNARALAQYYNVAPFEMLPPKKGDKILATQYNAISNTIKAIVKNDPFHPYEFVNKGTKMLASYFTLLQNSLNAIPPSQEIVPSYTEIARILGNEETGLPYFISDFIVSNSNYQNLRFEFDMSHYPYLYNGIVVTNPEGFYDAVFDFMFGPDFLNVRLHEFNNLGQVKTYSYDNVFFVDLKNKKAGIVGVIEQELGTLDFLSPFNDNKSYKLPIGARQLKNWNDTEFKYIVDYDSFTIRGIRIYENGSLARNYVPVELADKTLTLADKVHNKIQTVEQGFFVNPDA